jgi:hypothetical protein
MFNTGSKVCFVDISTKSVRTGVIVDIRGEMVGVKTYTIRDDMTHQTYQTTYNNLFTMAQYWIWATNH